VALHHFLFFKNEQTLYSTKIDFAICQMNNLSILHGIITILHASHLEKHFLWANEAENQHCDLTPLFLFSRTENSFGKINDTFQCQLWYSYYSVDRMENRQNVPAPK
jgi:hypothetical protein